MPEFSIVYQKVSLLVSETQKGCVEQSGEARGMETYQKDAFQQHRSPSRAPPTSAALQPPLFYQVYGFGEASMTSVATVKGGGCVVGVTVEQGTAEERSVGLEKAQTIGQACNS